MTSPLKPALKRAFGNDSWAWVTTISSKSAPTNTEINTSTSFNLSCSLFGDQDGVTATTDKVTLPRRLCETETFEVNGATSYAAPDFMVSFDPQGASGSDGKKAWAAMTDDATGYLVRRQGKNANAQIVGGDFVDVIPAQLGVKVPTKTGNDADGVYAFTVSASVTDTPAWNVAVTGSSSSSS